MVGQSVSIKCVNYTTFTEADCVGCGLKAGTFSGLIVDRSGKKIAIHSPFSIKYRNNKVIISDSYKNSVALNLGQIVLVNKNNRTLNTYLYDCLCDPSGMMAIKPPVDSVAFVDVTPALTATNDSLMFGGSAIKGLPSGGSTGQVLSKVDGTNYNAQWTTPSTGATFTLGTTRICTNPETAYPEFATTVTSGKKYFITIRGYYKVNTLTTPRLQVKFTFPSSNYIADLRCNTYPSSVNTWNISDTGSTFATLQSQTNVGVTDLEMGFEARLYYNCISSGTLNVIFASTAGTTTNPRITIMAGTTMEVREI